MAQIRIDRISGYSNKYRKIKLVLNEQVVGSINDGEIKIINVPAGKHKFKAKIDWCQSNELEFNLEEGAKIELILKGTNPFFAIYYIFFDTKNYLVLDHKK
ncbi:MAG: hypothetical protein IT222_11415 [Crocinitomix sp.]|nr:hypothetical protein [Crocinitomix sp.]